MVVLLDLDDVALLVQFMPNRFPRLETVLAEELSSGAGDVGLRIDDLDRR